MGYVGDISILSGAMTGAALSPLFYEKILPVIRAIRKSEVPLIEIDLKKATSLDMALSEWSSLNPFLIMTTDIKAIRESMPQDVQEVFDRHIHTGGVHSIFDGYKLRERVRNLYGEPVFRQYLHRS